MKPLRLLLAVAALAAATSLLPAQDYAPSNAVAPDEATLKAIAERADRLGGALQSLRRRGVPETLLVEVEVYEKAALGISRHNEFYQKDYAAWTLDALDRGQLRATQLSRGESPWLTETGHAVVRAYRSRLDDSVQPYAVFFPPNYGKDLRKKWRLDVVLHGRD